MIAGFEQQDNGDIVVEDEACRGEGAFLTEM
jgi:ABC-type Fe3+/spermidine/putrescine transport system ATPase subunit